MKFYKNVSVQISYLHMPEKMSSIRGQDMTMVTLVLDLKYQVLYQLSLALEFFPSLKGYWSNPTQSYGLIFSALGLEQTQQ